jgi:hypothetical protein
MNAANMARVQSTIDYIFDSCTRDSNGNMRSDKDRLSNYSRYIGWLEGNIMSLLNDEQAEKLLDRIEVWSKQNAVDEATLQYERDGSFF